MKYKHVFPYFIFESDNTQFTHTFIPYAFKIRIKTVDSIHIPYHRHYINIRLADKPGTEVLPIW